MSVFSKISSINTWLSDLSRNSNKSRFALINDLLQLRRTKAVFRNEYANFRLYDREEVFRNIFYHMRMLKSTGKLKSSRALSV